MIELIRILRVMAEVLCGGEESLRKKCSIKFSDLERFVFDELWQKQHIATYSTVWTLEEEIKRLAVLGVVKYESDEIIIEDISEFLKKIAPFELVTRNMIAGNIYLKYVIQRIEDSAREYAKNIVQQPA